MHVWVDYPNREEELAILELDSNQQQRAPQPPAQILAQEQLFKIRADSARLYLDPKLNNYIVDLVQASVITSYSIHYTKLYDRKGGCWKNT